MSLLPFRIYSAYLKRFLSRHFGSVFFPSFATLFSCFLFSLCPSVCHFFLFPICLLSMSNLSFSLSLYLLVFWMRLGVWGLVLICKSIVISVSEFKLREVLMWPVLFHTGNDKFALQSSLDFLPFLSHIQNWLQVKL